MEGGGWLCAQGHLGFRSEFLLVWKNKQQQKQKDWSFRVSLPKTVFPPWQILLLRFGCLPRRWSWMWLMGQESSTSFLHNHSFFFTARTGKPYLCVLLQHSVDAPSQLPAFQQLRTKTLKAEYLTYVLSGLPSPSPLSWDDYHLVPVFFGGFRKSLEHKNLQRPICHSARPCLSHGRVAQLPHCRSLHRPLPTMVGWGGVCCEHWLFFRLLRWFMLLALGQKWGGPHPPGFSFVTSSPVSSFKPVAFLCCHPVS